MSEFVNIRAFFSKTGNAKYISHLDLYRAFSRAVKRCGLPVWITEGFNPHIYMTFALPLALGIESAEESVDLRLTEPVSFEQITLKLNEVMPSGLRIIRVAAPVLKASEIEKAVYEISVLPDGFLDEYFSRDSIEITKKTKKSVQVIDVKPLLKWENQRLTLPAGNSLNINPWNVLSDADTAQIKRVEILCANGDKFA